MNAMTQAFILLLAGFIVVFTVLILLIIIVSVYSKIVSSVQNKGKKDKKTKPVVVKFEPPAAPVVTAETETAQDSDEIPLEIIAVIAAAVDAVYGEKPHRIKAVKKSRASRSAWSRAGVLDNTRPF